MKPNPFIISLAALLATAVGASAVVYTIPGVYSTGVDDAGNPLAPGMVDPHYTIESSPAGAIDAQTASVYFMWTGNTPSSAWITAFGDEDAPAGFYVYSMVFSLDGFDPATASITGKWASDNNSTIFLNGVSTGISHTATPWEFTTLQDFTISNGFVPGLNTLSFVVYQQPSTADNPDGVQVQILSATAALIPEPGVFTLLGLGATAFLLRRNSRARA
ncbi:MAG TPA: PEP-CTERM sorting domain-containing protein [Verrucomicrobiota bacterium]|nr:PEP-CTERM sorting domain-containing protein [Verrucomicrobiota bacterium]HPU56975.1 PEP-CTERM sorting domain-containing protein [Verrucomicrobiota bacterium]